MNCTTEQIPGTLRECAQWIVWRFEDRDGKESKIPYSVRGSMAATNRPGDWTTFAAVQAAYQRGGYSGVGFVFTADDDFCGVDLDGCRDPATGEIAEWASEVMARVDTYCEVSPSGTGVKLFLIGGSPFASGKKTPVNAPKIGDKSPGIEVYDRGRYFVVTGQKIDGPDEPQERNIEWIKDQFWPPAKPTNGHASNGHERASADRGQILERARQYLAKIPPAIAGEFNSNGKKGHDATLAATCAMFRKFDLTADEVYGLMSAWNLACVPPWPDRDLRRKVDEADKLVTDTRGEFVKDEPTRKPRKKRAAATVATGDGPRLTDMGNAARMAAQHGQDVRYCTAWRKWLTWDGTRWAQDGDGETMRLAKTTVTRLYSDAAALPDGPRQALVKHALESEAASRLRAMVSLCESEPGIPVQPADLDRDPWLLNCTNGTLDLRTGDLRPHNRADLLTKCCPVAWDVRAECSLWMRFLHDISAGDVDLMGFLQRAAGMSLSGAIREHCLLFCHGTGANGKSVFLNTLSTLLGQDYAMKAAPELLMVKKGESHPTERADLFGKRLVACIEVDGDRRMAEGLVKELTGGDKIRARRMREDFWEFDPTHKIWLSANHKPSIRGTDHGIWRRIRLVPFGVTIPEERQDKRLAERLLAELPGILAWAVEGCLSWQADGLAEPAAVRTATDAYRAESDALAGFLAACCTMGAKHRAKSSELYLSYTKWCASSGEYAHSARKFCAAMREKNYRELDCNGTWFLGIGLLKTQETAEPATSWHDKDTLERDF